MRNIFDSVIEPYQVEKQKTLHPSDFLPGIIKQRNIEPNAQLIFYGLSTDRPDGSTHVQAYFATDTGVLSCFDGSAWLDTTLS